MTPATWLAVAQRIQAISQTGLAFAQNPYDVGRYRELSEIAASMMAGPEPAQVTLAAGVFSSERGYATPKVDVRAAVLREGRLLLVREREDGCWTLPGGWADVGQSAAECVEREALEESGYVVKATRLLACWDRNKHSHPPYPFYVYKLVFECEFVGGAPAASDETSEVGFFGEDQIPELSRARILPDQIRFVFDALRNSWMPAAFD
jgi:ADP-ribose pyrophosphatase YjhB (NUDIX family)